MIHLGDYFELMSVEPRDNGQALLSTYHAGVIFSLMLRFGSTCNDLSRLISPHGTEWRKNWMNTVLISIRDQRFRPTQSLHLSYLNSSHTETGCLLTVSTSDQKSYVHFFLYTGHFPTTMALYIEPLLWDSCFLSIYVRDDICFRNNHTHDTRFSYTGIRARNVAC